MLNPPPGPKYPFPPPPLLGFPSPPDPPPPLFWFRVGGVFALVGFGGVWVEDSGRVVRERERVTVMSKKAKRRVVLVFMVSSLMRLREREDRGMRNI